MKTAKFCSLLCLTLICCIAHVAAADDNIKLQVAVKSDNARAKTSQQETHSKWLEVSATAFHLPKPAQVRVEWTFFGDDLKADKVIKHGQGTESAELSQSKNVVLKTKPTAFAFTPRHAERTGSGKRARYKTVEATGIRYHGWVVCAFIGDTLAGEAYSTPALKKLMK